MTGRATPGIEVNPLACMHGHRSLRAYELTNLACNAIAYVYGGLQELCGASVLYCQHLDYLLTVSMKSQLYGTCAGMHAISGCHEATGVPDSGQKPETAFV